MGLDQITALAFSLRTAPGAYALLIGSGVSSATGIPTGWDIVLDLIRRIAAVEKADATEDPVAYYVKTFNEAATYANVMAKVARTQAERQELLRRYIEPTAEQRASGVRVPTAAHRAIAELVRRQYVRVILTTNFDRLIEQALEERGVSFDVIDSVDALRGARPLSQSPAVLVKLHGDYRDARLRNTPAELGAYEPEIDQLLDRILDEHGLIVCGWSATWDDALRAAIRRQPNRRFTTFWSARSELGPEATELVKARDAIVISSHDAERFFTQLERKVTALEEVDRPHPLSVKTAVAELKRYLPDPQARLRLEDLLQIETERAADAIAPARFPAQAPGSNDDAQRRVARYEAAVEILVGLLATGCSHSAGPEQDRLYSGVIERVAETAAIESGLTAYIALRKYPGLVCLYAAGMSALVGERWATLRELWFGRTTRDPSGRPVPLLAGLFLHNAFQDVNAQTLLHPKADPNRRMFTPISDHLYDLLREPLRELLRSDERYASAFDRYELLSSMALFDLNASWTAQGYVPDGFIGSFAWRYRMHTEGSPVEWATNELARSGANWPLLQSGLFGGEPQRFSAALAAAVALAQKLPWF